MGAWIVHGYARGTGLFQGDPVEFVVTHEGTEVITAPNGGAR